MNFNDIIPNIVSGFEIMKDESVILNFWGDNEDLDILDIFTLEVLKAGGKPVRMQQSRNFLLNYFKEFSTLKLFDANYYNTLKDGNIAIDIFTYSPKPHKNFPKEKLELYREYLKNTFNALSENKRLFMQVRVPTREIALEEDLDYITYKNAILNALNIDYTILKNETKILIKKLESKKLVEIETLGNNILNFSIDNRQWYRDDGIGDIPCGEVYIAPIEESANGTLLIPKISLDGCFYYNVLLEFEGGKLINSSHKELLDFINKFQGDYNIIAELGIGLNKNVKDLIGYSVLDEKCNGTIHIAIGANTMFGGNNKSSLHFDFVFTPLSLKFDNELFTLG